MNESLPSELLKIATFRPPNTTYERNTLIMNYDGTSMRVFQAPMIRLLAKGLGVAFNIVTPEDNTFGRLKPDRKSTGINGMIERGEADLSVSGFSMTQEKLEAFPFTYPLHVTDATFMTNKLEPYTKSSAIYDVFSLEVWLSIGLCLILISLLLYFLLKWGEKFTTILFNSIGCLLEQSLSIEARQRNTALLLLHWFIGVAILSASYKAVILSIMTAPKLVGIRDISDFSKAAKQNSIKCFTWEGMAIARECYAHHNSKAIGECAIKSNSEGLYGLRAFHKYPYKKTFLAERVEIRKYRRYYHLSDDSLHISYIGIPYARHFCCPKKLETVVHRIVAAGLYEKTLTDQDFTAQMRLPKELGIADDNTGVLPLKLEDFTGAFIVLFAGYLCSLLVLIAEITYKKFHSYYFINDGKCMKICHVTYGVSQK